MRPEQTEYQKSQRTKQVERKPALFSEEARRPGLWGRKRYPHVLHESRAAENLHESLRHGAMEYFACRDIPWQGDGSKSDEPTGNLFSSQVLCANTLYHFAHRPDHLLTLLMVLGIDARRVLPIPKDAPGRGLPGDEHFVAFEWHDGSENLLRERGGSSRPRGAHATSADFTILFERMDGGRELLLGEWKYTEAYDATPKQFSARGTDRATIYEHALRADWNPIRWAENGLAVGDLMYDPFDQLMRLQLLAAAIEHHWPTVCDSARVLWVVPGANDSLANTLTSHALQELAGRAAIAPSVRSVWTHLVGAKRFRTLATEDLLEAAKSVLSDVEPAWTRWMSSRYEDLR